MDAILETYSPMVHNMARSMEVKSNYALCADDLYQEGMLSIIESQYLFVDYAPQQMSSYLRQRVNGAMLDSIREGDVISRRARRNRSHIIKATERLTKLNGVPRCKEVSDFLKISLSTYHSHLCDSNMAFTYVDDYDACVDTSADPCDLYERKEFAGKVLAVFESLPVSQQMAISMYYENGLKLAEIGKVLDVTESRACQLVKAGEAVLLNISNA